MTRILSVFNLLKRVGFAVLLLEGVVFAGPMTVNAPNSTYFIANEGQWEGDFQFKCEVGSTVYYVTPKGMTVDFREFKKYPKPQDQRDPMAMFERDRERDSVTVRGHVVQIQYVSSSASRGEVRGDEKLAHYSNYFFGRDSTKWRSRVGHYQKIIVPEVWPGIDVEYHADHFGVETIYHVKPGADPAQIQMEYLGLDAPLRVDAQGNLVLTTSLGDTKEKTPYSFQIEAQLQRVIPSNYRLIAESQVGFEVSGFDRAKELTIDPVLYGTYLGGGEYDKIEDITFGTDSSIFVAGNSESQMADGFPVTPGAYETAHAWPWSAPFVVKLNPAGDSVRWGSFINARLCGVRDVEVTTSGEPVLVVACEGDAENWPLTANALDTTLENYEYGIAHFSDDGAELLFSTFLGGPSLDIAWDAAIDQDNRIWVCGSVYIGFPTTPDAMYPDHIGGGDAGISIINLVSHTLDYSTFWGGQAWGASDEPRAMQIINNMEVAIGGWVYYSGSGPIPDLPATPDAYQQTWRGGISDGFFAIVNFETAVTEYCTFLGGIENDDVSAMSRPLDGVWALAGSTGSGDFPLTAGAVDTVIQEGPQGREDAFVMLLELPSEIIGCTFLGGLNRDYPLKIEVSANHVTVAGWTESENFPVTSNAFDTIYNDNGQSNLFTDFFVSRLNWQMTELEYSTYFGGFHTENFGGAKFENDNIVWLVGETGSTNLPTTPDSWSPTPRAGSEGFIFRFAIDDPPVIAPQCTLKVDSLSIVRIGEDIRLRWKPARMMQDTCDLPDSIGYAVFHAVESQGPYLNLNQSSQTNFTHLGAVRHSPRQFYIILAFDASLPQASPQLQEIRQKKIYLKEEPHNY